jgi:hypothetical protein
LSGREVVEQDRAGACDQDVLQEHQFERGGDAATIRSNVRVIPAGPSCLVGPRVEVAP